MHEDDRLREFMKNHPSAGNGQTCFGKPVDQFNRDQLLWIVYELFDQLEYEKNQLREYMEVNEVLRKARER